MKNGAIEMLVIITAVRALCEVKHRTALKMLTPSDPLTWVMFLGNVFGMSVGFLTATRV